MSVQSKVTAATICGLLTLAISGAARAQDPGEFPPSLDEQNLRTWLAARTNLTPQAVVSIGSNSIIGLRSVTPDPAGPGRYHVQIRAEVINARTAAQGGYMSWSSDLDIDCTTRRSRAMGIVNYPARNLSGTGAVAGGPSANWVTPTIGTQLYSLVSAVCDQGFQRPLAGPSQVAQSNLPSTPPVIQIAPPAGTPQRTAPPAVVAAVAKPPPAPTVVAQAPPPPVLPVRPFERPPEKPAEPPKMQVAVAAAIPAPGDDSGRPAPAAPPPATFSPPPAPPPQVAMATPSPATSAARPRSRGSSGAGVQVAAAESQAGARAALSRIQRMSSDWGQLSSETVRADVGGRTVYRAILHGFASQGEANAMCERLKAKGGSCFVRLSWR